MSKKYFFLIFVVVYFVVSGVVNYLVGNSYSDIVFIRSIFVVAVSLIVSGLIVKVIGKDD